jgi:hypothetical protein
VTTYQTQSSFAELTNGEPLSEGTLAYFRERQRIRIHELVISEFLKSGISKADFARRIRKDPAQITRWLANPGNWELDTISDFLVGISGAEFDPRLSYPAKAEIQDQNGPDWLTSSDEVTTSEKSLSELVVTETTTSALSEAFSAPYKKLSPVNADPQGNSAQGYSANDNYASALSGIKSDPVFLVRAGAQ